jgi:cell division protein FtsL
MVFNFLELINEKSINLVEKEKTEEKGQALVKKKTMWQRWSKIILKNLIALVLVAAMYFLYLISLGTCPYSYDDPNV